MTRLNTGRVATEIERLALRDTLIAGTSRRLTADNAAPDRPRGVSSQNRQSVRPVGRSDALLRLLLLPLR